MSGRELDSETPADFVRGAGGSVGDVFYGSPIIERGVLIEEAKYVKVTAIGDFLVLGRTRKVGEETWGTEGYRSFGSRRWRRVPTADAFTCGLLITCARCSYQACANPEHDDFQVDPHHAMAQHLLNAHPELAVTTLAEEGGIR
jgi:hypothetical protein